MRTLTKVLLQWLGVLALLPNSSFANGRDVRLASQKVILEQWGQKAIVELTDERFDDGQLLREVKPGKRGADSLILSMPSFRSALTEELTEKRTAEEVFSSKDGKRNDKLLYIQIAGLRKSYSEGECGINQLAYDFSTQAAITLLEPGIDDAEKAISEALRFHGEVYKAAKCPETWKYFYIADGNDTDAFSKPYFISSLISAAIVNYNVRTKCRLSFGYGVGDKRIPACFLERKLEIPKKFEPVDIAKPLYHAKLTLDGVLAQEELKRQAYSRILEKMIEIGVYLDDIGIKPKEGVPVGKYEVSIDGVSVGTFEASQMNPYLYATVSKSGTCRRILTRSGFQTFCIQRAESEGKKIRLK